MNEKIDLLKSLVLVTGLLLATIFVGWLTAIAFDRNAVVQCHKLEQQSREFKDFYITKYEKALCDDHSIEIDAPVR